MKNLNLQKTVKCFLISSLMLINIFTYSQLKVVISPKANPLNACDGTDYPILAIGSGGSGIANYDYIWSGQTSKLNTTSGSDVIFNSTEIGATYSLTVTLTDKSDGKTATANVTVKVLPIPKLLTWSADTTVCKNTEATLRATSDVGAIYWYDIDGNGLGMFSPYKFIPQSDTVTILVQASNIYCIAVKPINVYRFPLPVFSPGPDTTICETSTYTFTKDSAKNFDEIRWRSDGTGTFDDTTKLHPTYTLSADDKLNKSSVKITMLIKKIGNCPDTSKTMTLTLQKLPKIWAGPDTTVCAGTSYQFLKDTANNYLSLKWTSDGTGTFTSNTTLNPTYIPSDADTAKGVVKIRFTAIAFAPCDSIFDEMTLNINPPPPVDAGDPKTICSLSPLTLKSKGAVTYLWDIGASTDTTTVRPAVNTTYTVTGTDSKGCTASDNVAITTNPLPPADAGQNVTICKGKSDTLIATGGLTYKWSTNATNDTIIVSPASSTTYYLTVTDANGCTAKDSVFVTVDSLPPVNAGNPQTICKGDNINLTATGGNSYLWDEGSSTATILVNPVLTTTYIITGTGLNGCSASDSVIVKVNNLPNADAGTSKTICKLDSITLTASGGIAYKWSTGVAKDTLVSIKVSPANTTTYTVTVTDLNKCSATDSTTVIVNPLPSTEAGIDQTICPGGNASLNVSGGKTYKWSNGSTDSSIVVIPINTTKFKVTATDANGCSAADSIIVNVNQIPPADASANKTICIGDSINLTATGGVTYKWNTTETNATINVKPIIKTTYCVTVYDAINCSATDCVTVTVNKLPIVNAGTNLTICLNSSAKLVATGGVNYSWSPGVLPNNDTITVSPNINTTYTTTVTDANGCSNTDDVIVAVTPAIVAEAGNAQTICQNSTITLKATGGSTYLWSNNVSTDTNRVKPMVNTIYTVTAYGGFNCSGTDNVVITVNIAPTAEAGAGKTICSAKSVSFTASGGISYKWSNNDITSTINTNPLITTKYFVTVTDNNSCTAVDSVVATVNPLPPTDAGANQTICLGNSTSLTATGGLSYIWNYNGAKTSSITVTPVSNTTYSVTATDINGCSAKDSVIVTTNILTTADAGQPQTICRGGCTKLKATGGSVYNWSPGPLPTTDTVNVCPIATTTYSVTVTAIGCPGFSLDNVVITVITSPPIDAGSNKSICIGSSTTLTATGGLTYIWDNGSTASSIIVNPITTTTYKVTGTGTNGCTASDMVVVTVNSLPIVEAGQNQTICNSKTATLTATGGTSFIWSNGQSTASISVTPAVTTSYCVTVSDNNGCSNSDCANVNVNKLPIADAGNNLTLCKSTCTNLTATGGNSYKWNTGPTTNIINTCPLNTTTYIVTVTDLNNCSAADNVIITVVNLPTTTLLSNDADNKICQGDNVTFTANGATNYEFIVGGITVQGPSFLNTYTSSLLSNGQKIKVIGTDLNSCKSVSDSITIIVNQVPTAVITNSTNPSVCKAKDGTATVLASNGVPQYLYLWSNGQTNATALTLSANVYSVTVTDQNGCKGKTSITINDPGAPPVTLVSTELDKTICSGESVTFTATSTSNVFEFIINGNTVQGPSASSTFTTTTLKNKDSVIVKGTDILGCSAFSSAITFNVKSLPTAIISGSKTICQNDSITLTVSLTGNPNWSLTYTDGFSNKTINGIKTSPYIFKTKPISSSNYKISNVTDAICTNNSGIGTAVVNVNPLPTANFVGSSTICNGQTKTLCVVLTGTPNWNLSYTDGLSPITINNIKTSPYCINVTPNSNTTYKPLTISDANCSNKGSDSAIVKISPIPTAFVSGNSTICIGQNAQLSLSLTGTPNWNVIYSDGNINDTILNINKTNYNFNVKPSKTATYSIVSVFDSKCTNNGSGSATVNVTPGIPVEAGNPQTVCSGQLTTLTATGGNTYIWENGKTTSSIGVTPIISGYYSVTATDNNSCTASDNVYINVNALPKVNLTSDDADNVICKGNNISFTGSGAQKYQFLVNSKIVLGPSFVNKFLSNTLTNNDTILVVGTDSNSCFSNSSKIIVKVNSNPTINVDSLNNPSACGASDGSIKITVSNGQIPYNYSWNTNPIQNNAKATGLNANVYIITVTDFNKCYTTSLSTLKDPGAPNVNLVSSDIDNTICKGDFVTFTSSGATNYEFFVNGVSIQGPISSNTFTTNGLNNNDIVLVKGYSSNNCSSISNPIKFVVNNLPTAIINGSYSLCKGKSATVNVSFTGLPNWNFTYSDGSSNTNVTNVNNSNYSFNVNPIINTTYTIVSVSDANCSNSIGIGSAIVNINPIPIADAGLNQSICIENNVVLTANGGTKYLWNTTETTKSITVKPVITTTYNVTVTDINLCSATDLVVINVNPLPNVTLTSSDVDNFICLKDTITFTANGAYLYEFYINGVSQGAQSVSNTLKTFKLTKNDSILKVKAIDKNNCSSSSKDMKFRVFDAPTTSITNYNNPTVCGAKDGNAIVNVSGGTPFSGPPQYYIYQWNTVPQQSLNTAIGLGANVYEVIVTDKNGCISRSSVALKDPTSPNVTLTSNDADNTICSGSNIVFTAGGAATYQFYLNSISVQGPGASNSFNSSKILNGDSVFVKGIDGGGCTGYSKAVKVIVNDLPTATINGSFTICNGQSQNISVALKGKPNWTIKYTDNVNPVVNVANITTNPYILKVTPNSNTTYNITSVSDANCTNNTGIGSAVVNVNTSPKAEAGNNVSICLGNNVSLTASGGSTYLWNNNLTTNTIADNPTKTTKYFVTVTDLSKCSAVDSVSVIVNPLPKADAGPNANMCNSASVTLTANGGISYKWNNGPLVATNTVSPKVTTTYFVTVTDANNCSASDFVFVYANPLPTATISGSDSVCFGDSTKVNINLTGTPLWDLVYSDGTKSTNVKGIVNTPYIFYLKPTATATYTITSINDNFCTNTGFGNFIASVAPTPTMKLPVDTTICNGESKAIKLTLGALPTWDISYKAGNNPPVVTKGVASSPYIFNVKPTAKTSYIITAKNKYGCFVKDTLIVDVLPFVVPIITANGPDKYCDSSNINLTLDAGAPYTSYLWSTSATTQTINIKKAGAVDVEVSSLNGCKQKSIPFVIAVYPKIKKPVLISTRKDTFCQGDSTVLKVSLPYYTYKWSSGSFTPSIKVTETAKYTVIATDTNGCSDTSLSKFIKVNPKPIANISYVDSALKVEFYNFSLYQTKSEWKFGDGDTTSKEEPTHSYKNYNTKYHVVLTVTNTCGTDKDSTDIMLLKSSILAAQNNLKELKLYPNPTRGNLNIKLNNFEVTNADMIIYNAVGQQVYYEKLQNISERYTKHLDISNFNRGVYYVHIITQNGVINKKVILD